MNESSSRRAISIRGARQNNLKNLDLDIATDALTVVTGVSGSGKSSLVFDTLYAEGQRRYVETFSPYARQFLDRMDRPQVERIEGIPPAIAIDQTNPVRTSRSTVGTMTELNDYLKLLFARAATLFCRNCGQPVQRDDPASITRALAQRVPLLGDPHLIISFSVPVPHNFSEQEVLDLLARQGYTRILGREGASVEAVQDRFRWSAMEPARLAEALEGALRAGQGRLAVRALAEREGETLSRWRFSTDWHCADCDIHYAEASPAAFSFNSPIGACETCRGFGRVIGVDLALVVPDESKTLRGGAVKPWQTESFKECQSDLETCARKDAIPLDLPVRDFNPEQRQWLFEGAAGWVSWAKSWPGKWYGVRRFFEWLESKAYKMHIRVLLSRYRSYTLCPTCQGARLKPEAQWWRVGSRDNAARARSGSPPWAPQGVSWSEEILVTMPGLTPFELSRLPIGRLARFFERLWAELPRHRGARDTALKLLLGEIGSRLAYLETVGLGYLTLDRQSRTLSGGEVQRINLTTALGTSLINTLFVLDEPSIGLHPRDVGRIVEVMQRLRDAGNTLVVVEHDPQIMLAADRLIDLGPGPGERGGELVYHGPAAAIGRAATLTAAYLSGAKRVSRAHPVRDLAHAPTLRLTSVREHNLKELDVAFPLGGLVCVTGVSGSGKSTLVAEVLYPAVAKALGVASEAPGLFGALYGAELLSEVVLVDQSPIGKTTRSNPASYVGAFDAIRARFAAQPEAQKRGYTAGTFSFNTGNGRCPTCGGNGFEHVEMQFLSDVYLRCPDCNGTRYRSEVGEIKYRGKNIAEVLELTVAETLSFFSEERDLAAKLQPLIDVGLEYLRLGQPVPTLSGGEAQRLKLAGHLAQSAGARAKPTLFLFDEPTTGLHFEDIARLLSAFEKLIAAGHSLVVIEHNLDLIAAADWVIDLGPEGGEAGGELVFSGSLAQLLEHRSSFTGAALRDYLDALGVSPSGATPALREAPARRYQPVAAVPRPASILVHHAREHNLKNIDLAIPLDRFTVLTGVSGSGKSTLAFDIIFNEGQRRYLESLNAYARQFVQPAGRPEVDAIHGIPPTVAIEQRTSRGGRKSTVATLTEIYHFLRLWYVKLGTQHCPECQLAIEPQSPEAIAARILAQWKGHNVQLLAPLVVNRKGLYTDLAKWARNKGFAQLRVDGEMLPTAKWPRLARFSEHNIELPVAKLAVSARNEKALREAIAVALEFGKGVL
ncbi:partial UvrABC system protein A, partial [Burkholderiales bacterium]